MKLCLPFLRKKLRQYWEGDDEGFAVLWDGGSLCFVGEYSRDSYPFEALVTYDPQVEAEVIYKRV